MGIRIWRRLVPVLVLALGAGAGLAFVAAAIVRPAPLPVDRTPVPLAGHRPCAAVQVFFDAGTDARDLDAEMRKAAAALADDPTARRVYTETQAEAWVRFQEVFKDRPDLLAEVSQENMPAMVTVVPVPGTDLTAYAADLAKRFPAAKNAQTYDLNAVRERVAPDKRGPACPRAGEF
ncbi:permease-like cell division protein FtsX [Amycolatopsis sp. NPDC051903]|uniref:permease-like cell division protein FtsX n=1 Tax=Amycolatopsis sp. NPDC051903 TaxID=3363936 RepID=UPI0037A63C3F